MTLFHFIVAGFAALFPLLNPVGGVAIYASMSSHLDPAEKRKQAIKTAIYIFILLAVFGLLGTLILKGLGLTIPALQLAGGLIVGAAGFGMINPKPEHEENIKSKHEGSRIFPSPRWLCPCSPARVPSVRSSLSVPVMDRWKRSSA